MWVVVDANYLAHRAYHSMRGLSHNGDATGMLFGFLRDVKMLQEYQPSRMVFCFDRGRGARRAVYGGYKGSRDSKYSEASAEDREGIEEFRRQVQRLARHYLPRIGFRNILSQPGYEADDHIAAVVENRTQGCMMVSADKDLWQLLDDDVIRRVTQYNPHSKVAMTAGQLRAEWGVSPSQWVEVKAIAGCTTDDVPGVPGVGEKTAARWVQGTLGQHTKAYKKIDESLGMIARNMKLVRLPYPGTNTPVIKPDEVTPAGWRDVLGELGIKTLDMGDEAPAPRGVRHRKGMGFSG